MSRLYLGLNRGPPLATGQKRAVIFLLKLAIEPRVRAYAGADSYALVPQGKTLP